MSDPKKTLPRNDDFEETTTLVAPVVVVDPPAPPHQRFLLKNHLRQKLMLNVVNQYGKITGIELGTGESVEWCIPAGRTLGTDFAIKAKRGYISAQAL